MGSLASRDPESGSSTALLSEQLTMVAHVGRQLLSEQAMEGGEAQLVKTIFGAPSMLVDFVQIGSISTFCLRTSRINLRAMLSRISLRLGHSSVYNHRSSSLPPYEARCRMS